MELSQLTREISNKEQLAVFVAKLQDDFVSSAEDWENQDIGRYLAAIAAWLTDMDGYYTNLGKEPPINPTWSTFAEVLLAAKYYE